MRGRLWAAAVCAVVVVGFTAMAAEKPSAEYQKAMKDLGAANASLRINATAKDYVAVEKDAATLKAAFTVADTFWTAKKADDAIKMSKDGLKASIDLDTAAKAKSDEGIAAAQKIVGGTCAACHAAHRETIYEIK